MPEAKSEAGRTEWKMDVILPVEREITMVADVKRPDTMALDEVKTVIGGGSEVVVLCVNEVDSVRASEPVLVWLIVIVLG